MWYEHLYLGEEMEQLSIAQVKINLSKKKYSA